MKKREIILVFALVIFGVFYQAVEKGKVRFAGDFSFYSDERKLRGSRFAEFPEPEKLFAAVERVTIENPAGEIIVGPSADGQVHLVSLLRVYYAEKGDVEAQRRRVQVRADLAGGELKVGLRYQSPFPYRYLRVLFHLQVPQETALTVANREGDTIIKEAGKEIRISQENGNLFLEKLRSRLDLRLRNCNANLKDIADHAEINASHGSLTVENAVSLRLDGQHGECRLQNVEKDVVVEYSFGKLTVDGAGKVEINSRHCDISVRNVRDGAVISNKFERVVLENVSGDVRLSGRSSPIVLRQAKAGNVVIENSYADTSIQDFSGKSLDVLLKNGSLVLGVASVDERINVQAQNAELDLTFAILADPTFNIKTQHGRIIADPALGLETFTENEENFANRAGQKPEIFINNSYGDVRVKTAK